MFPLGVMLMSVAVLCLGAGFAIDPTYTLPEDVAAGEEVAANIHLLFVKEYLILSGAAALISGSIFLTAAEILKALRGAAGARPAAHPDGTVPAVADDGTAAADRNDAGPAETDGAAGPDKADGAAGPDDPQPPSGSDSVPAPDGQSPADARESNALSAASVKAPHGPPEPKGASTTREQETAEGPGVSAADTPRTAATAACAADAVETNARPVKPAASVSETTEPDSALVSAPPDDDGEPASPRRKAAPVFTGILRYRDRYIRYAKSGEAQYEDRDFPTLAAAKSYIDRLKAHEI